jgi:hypothetical protein
MPNRSPFPLNRSGVLLALISAAFASQAQAAAGRVEFAIGPASIVGADGRTRPAARGTEVDTGDTVRTQQNGRVQVRMADGAYISLQPNTEFGIKDYRFAGKTDGSESAFYSLLKGAMRTVTGLIGRVNRNKYLVSTPTATVGIRGTGGVIQVQDDGSTLVQGTSGIWFLANPSGTIDIPAGVSGVAPSDPNQPPQETTRRAHLGPGAAAPAAGVRPRRGARHQPARTSSHRPRPQGILTSGSGYSIGAALRFGTNLFSSGDGGATASFNSSGQMIDVSFASEFYKLEPGGSHADFGTDGILAWGRWIGPVSVTSSWLEGTSAENYDADEGLHYVVGLPTARLPTTGTATFTLLGATRPTFVDGSGTAGTFSFAPGGNMTVNFFGGGATISLSGAQVTMPSLGTYEMNGSTAVCGAGSSFSFSPAVTGSGLCVCTCSSLVNGFFAGASAERAGLTYHISDFLAGKEVIGAVALKQ